MVYTPEVMKLIHIFAIFIFGPLLIMIGMLGKKTPPFFFLAIMLMGSVTVLFHSITLYQELMLSNKESN